MKNLLKIVALLGLLTAPAATAGAATYYVATDGSDAAAGTNTWTAWLTIDKATSTMVAGDTTYVRGGTYRESAVFDNSGDTTNGYITLAAYPGEQPTIDGSTFAEAWGAVLGASGKSYIVVDGLDVTGTATGISVGFQGPGTNITVKNGEITGHNGKMCIWFKGDGALKRLQQVTVDNMYVHNNITSTYEAIRFDANIRYFKAINCRVVDNSNIGIDAVGWKHDPELNPMYGLFQGNTVTGTASSGNGLYSDGASQVVIQHNWVYSNAYGISISAESAGDTQTGSGARYNYVWKNLNAGLTLGNGTITNGKIEDCFGVHNTFAGNTAVAWSHDLGLNWTLPGISYMNNITAADDNYQHKLLYTRSYWYNQVSFTADGNRYYPTDAVFESVQGNTSGFAAYQSLANPNEVHSTAGDPGFTNYGADDYTLASGSACRDIAVPIAVTTDANTGTAMSVSVSVPIRDGHDGLYPPDELVIGTNLPVAVVSVDNASNTVVLAASRSWAVGDKISYYRVGGVRVYYGTGADVGANEYLVTDTPTSTATPTPTNTPTATPTRTPTSASTQTCTATSTLTPRDTRTWTPTHTPTVTKTPTKTLTSTRTITRTRTPTITKTAIKTKTATRTITKTRTPTRTRTPTITKTITRTHTPTRTATRTVTMTRTATPVP